MLKPLLGCKSVERILLYLLVNEKCYAHQLHKKLQVALTPIQKALCRLEAGGIVISLYEGKMRLYRLNPEFPLINELEALLKKAFHLLSSTEKREYFLLNQSLGSKERKKGYELLDATWQFLKEVSQVKLIAKARTAQKESRRLGSGQVSVKQEENAIVFSEQGSWEESHSYSYNYSNSFRWVLNRLDGSLSLEHLRLGENYPVFLFHLIPAGENLLESRHPHPCKEDTYFGWVQQNPLFLQLHFKTIGPKKNEEIEYVYT